MILAAVIDQPLFIQIARREEQIAPHICNLQPRLSKCHMNSSNMVAKILN